VVSADLLERDAARRRVSCACRQQCDPRTKPPSCPPGADRPGLAFFRTGASPLDGRLRLGIACARLLVRRITSATLCVRRDRMSMMHARRRALLARVSSRCRARQCRCGDPVASRGISTASNRHDTTRCARRDGLCAALTPVRRSSSSRKLQSQYNTYLANCSCYGRRCAASSDALRSGDDGSVFSGTRRV